ncbi:MAG: serine/threonine-protein kinase [Planctomycetaceae bacterium]
MGSSESSEFTADPGEPEGAGSLPGANVLAAEVTFAAGLTIDRFEICEQLGKGSFGEVWKCRDTLLDRFVAIKVPRVGKQGPADSFLEEARRVSRLSHRGIVHLYDVLYLGNRIALVSELIEGKTLKDLLSSGPLPVEQLLRIIQDVAAGLQHAYEHGIVHRDVKPGNILVRQDGSAALTDFGLATSEVLLEQLRDVSSGTIKFMSPEQACGNRALLDNRTDIFCLGIVLFNGLTGKFPYPETSSSGNYLRNVAERNAKSLRAVDRRQPKALEKICNRCLARDPSSRYCTAQDLLDDLESYLSTMQAAATVPAAGDAPRSGRSLVWVTTGGCGVAATIVALCTVLWQVLVHSEASAVVFPPAARPESDLSAQPGQPWDFDGVSENGGLPTLQRTPVICVRPFSDDWSQPDYVREAEMWSVSSATSPVLAVCGSLGGRRPQLSVELGLQGWVGSVGLFWGLRPDPRSLNSSRFLCYAVEFLRPSQLEDAVLCVSEWTLLRVGPADKRIEVRRELFLQPVPIPSEDWVKLQLSADAEELQVQFGEQEFRVNASVLGVGGNWLPATPVSEGANQAGVTGRGATVAFRKLQ